MPEQNSDGLRLLSLDGGGIRGLSELLILKEIMERIQGVENRDEAPLPCDYFDLIGGTGTGGLIALMLGRLRMSVDGAISAYGSLVSQVFSDVQQVGGDGKFKASTLEKVIKGIVMQQTGQENERMMAGPPQAGGCKTFVLAMSALDMSARIPRLFRTYRAPKYPSPNCTIWEAGRATSATPKFFERVFIEGESYVDGGMGCNNPVQQVLQEAELIFPDRRPACIVSIGSGQAQTISIPKPGLLQRVLPLQVVEAMQLIATDCEGNAQAATRRFARTPGIYFRFNVDQGLQEVGLEQWERLDKVRASTGQYIRMAEVDLRLDAVVSIGGRPMVVSTMEMNMEDRSLC